MFRLDPEANEGFESSGATADASSVPVGTHRASASRMRELVRLATLGVWSARSATAQRQLRGGNDASNRSSGTGTIRGREAPPRLRTLTCCF